MKTITKFQCEVCQGIYNKETDAIACEKRPIIHDKGAKVGDTVRILTGEGAGKDAVITGLTVYEPGWGPSKYDHSRGVLADVVGSWGSRQLTFDDYKLVIK